MPSSVSNVDISRHNISGDSSVIQGLNSHVYSADANAGDSYGSSVAETNNVESSPLFSSPSPAVRTDDERNDVIQNIVGLLKQDAGRNPVASVNENTKVDKTTGIIWDLDDVEDWLGELQSATEPATASVVLDETSASQPSTLPVYNRPIDSVQLSAVSRSGLAYCRNNISLTSSSHCRHSGYCSQCCL